MMESACGMSGFEVWPCGSNRMPLKRLTASSIGRPYWSAMENALQNAWHIPEIAEPSFAILMKISPGVPSA